MYELRSSEVCDRYTKSYTIVHRNRWYLYLYSDLNGNETGLLNFSQPHSFWSTTTMEPALTMGSGVSADEIHP
jgi:hypothetical protein